MSPITKTDPSQSVPTTPRFRSIGGAFLDTYLRTLADLNLLQSFKEREGAIKPVRRTPAVKHPQQS